MKLYKSKVVAEWLAVTPNRVRQLRDAGVIVEKAPDLYELKASVARYIDYLRKRNTNLNEERAMLTRAKREAANMENDLRRGTLCSMKEIEDGLTTLCLNMRGRFSSLPAKLSGELAQMEGDQAGIFDRLKAAIDEALEELSRFNVAFVIRGGEAGDEEDG